MNKRSDLMGSHRACEHSRKICVVKMWFVVWHVVIWINRLFTTYTSVSYEVKMVDWNWAIQRRGRGFFMWLRVSAEPWAEGLTCRPSTTGVNAYSDMFSIHTSVMSVRWQRQTADYRPPRQQAHNIHTVVRACQWSAGRRLPALCCSSATLKTEDVVTHTVWSACFCRRRFFEVGLVCQGPNLHTDILCVL